MDRVDTNCQNSDRDMKFLFDQLSTARKEINNLRQQLKSLRYIHEKDVDNIKRLLGLCSDGVSLVSSNPESSRVIEPGTSHESEDVLKLKSIGVISTWFPSKRGTPRQSGICERVPGKLTLFNSVLNNPEHALEGLHEFSHMWILFHFHRNESTHIRAKVAPPRLNGARTGVFSTRSPHRPCPIGLSLVKIIKIENNTIFFEGVDMVDQTPVLDIKPYIPQYDNPLHQEKLNTRSMNLETLTNGDGTDLPMVQLPTNDNDNVQISNSQSEELSTAVNEDTDVSRDEEIALRLQAQEFQDYGNFENDVPDAILHILRPQQENIARNNHVSLMNSENNESSSRTEVVNETGETLERVRNNAGEDRTWRNSRLLEGADGPSTVCGTDLDLIRRRALNGRLDNSPIRMGVREAPDGEEGFETPILTPSQTVPGNLSVIEPIPLSVIAATTTTTTTTTTTGIMNTNTNEIRVPDWISRPQMSTLSVVFNERALAQLNEILDDKADEEKVAIENVLREDPRSVYLRQRWGNQFYTFLIHDLHITCRFYDSRKLVTVFQVRHAGRTCECGEPEWQCLGHSPLN
ncbi:tRNA (adenine(37)-N6)-methyltransferase [Leptopilina heterotoma]|uniref:tRNA (adenine(37)-N6)-methyltransferase n=1 Tax=Leptopilina heterotoma TaxID=63436 RepID=UPI001CA94AD1|nr:tRNA (adenine(37)-N6)-methyltransferase [Leptopilina heterotoma]